MWRELHQTRRAEEYEVKWHGALWRDDHVAVQPTQSGTGPQGLSPTKRPNEHRGGRKPVIANAVTTIMREAERPLSVTDVFERISKGQLVPPGKCTVGGVHSAVQRMKREGRVVRTELRTRFGEYGATYQYVPPTAADLEAIKLKPTKADIARLGGLGKAARMREREAAEC